MSKVVRIHEWIGLGIIVISLAYLASVAWYIVQNAILYKCVPPVLPADIPEQERIAIASCPSIIERIGYQIPGLFIGLAFLAFGLWTYMKGKEGVPVISIGKQD